VNPGYVLTATAAEEARQIIAYTAERWGDRQAPQESPHARRRLLPETAFSKT
jgi:plasmid stabilization system protein ParE